MQPCLRYLLMILFALVGAGGSHLIRDGDLLIVVGALMGAMAGKALGKLPRMTNKLLVGIFLALLFILSFVPVQTQESVVCDDFGPTASAR